MNDFKELQTATKNKEVSRETSGTRVQESRAVAEIQAAVLMAKQSPRNQGQAYLDIIDTCKRSAFAETALYAYPRGGTLVEGPSIRMAEVLARCWGNCRVGITIQYQDADKTEARAYAYDLQTNYMIDQDFTVPHKRTTRKGVQRLTDERDIRELVSNIGSRHLRGCILRLIPSDIVDDAEQQVKQTLISTDVPIGEQIKKMIKAFNELGVKVEHLEKRLGHNMDATIPQEIVTLKSIWKSIKDGMAKREDFFEIQSKVAEDSKEELKQLVEKNKKETKKEEKKDDE
jgi:regulator of replication initiation timing